MIFEILIWVLSFLIFLPNFNLFFSISKSEIFPWASIFSLSKNIRFSIPYFLFIIYLLFSAVYTFDKNGDWLQPLRSISAILNATFIFYRILFCTTKEFKIIEYALLIVFLVCLFVGVLQYINLFPSFLVEYMTKIVPRFRPNIPINDVRGISSLFSEPAYYAYSFNYAVFYLIYRKNIKPDSLFGSFTFLLVLIFNIFIIRSVTGLAFAILYLFFLFPIKKRLIFTSILIFASIIGFKYFSDYLIKFRSIQAFTQIFYNLNLYDIYGNFLSVSGFRAVSIMSSYLYGFLHFFGGGVGNWAETSAIAYQGLGIPASKLSYYVILNKGYFTGTRPTSIIADIMLESGLIGLILFLLSFSKYFFNKISWSNHNLRAFIIIILFNIFIIGTIGDPTPFIFLALICRNLFSHNLDI